MRYGMSAILGATALALLGYNGLTQPQAAAPKLAYINSTEVINQAPGVAEAQATFERELARWQSEVQALEDSLQQMMAAYEQQQIMLSPEARQQRQRAITAKQMEYQQRAADLQQVAEARQQELVGPIFDNIRNVLVAIQSEQGYTMIFDAAGTALLVADTTLDITPLVLERLRAQATAGGGPSN